MNFKPKMSRVEAFSDGVLAIIITLLVLELKVPHLHDVLSRGEAFESLNHLAPKFLSFVLSFIYIAIFWVNHHHFFDLIKRIDTPLVWQNNALLLCLSFIPFPTAFMGDYPKNSIALGLFAVILMLAGICFNVMWHYASQNGLMRDEVSKAFIAKAKRKGALGPICYAIAGAAAFVMPLAAWAIFIFIPIYYFFHTK